MVFTLALVTFYYLGCAAGAVAGLVTQEPAVHLFLFGAGIILFKDGRPDPKSSTGAADGNGFVLYDAGSKPCQADGRPDPKTSTGADVTSQICCSTKTDYPLNHWVQIGQTHDIAV